MASTYVAKVFTTPPIDHGDAVHFNPENEIKDADRGYEGTAPETLNGRLQFTDGDTVFAGAGVPGIVPDPVVEAGKFLRDNGTWEVPAGGGAPVFGGAGADGLVPDPVAENGYVLFDDGSWDAITFDTFGGAGTPGLVPDPVAEAGKVLYDDGTWAVPVDLTANYSWSGSHTFEDIVYGNTYWDDLRVAVSATEVVGSNPPDYAFFLNDGNGSPAYNALSLVGEGAGNNGYAVASDASAYPFTSDHSWSFWILPTIDTDSGDYYFQKIDVFRFRHWTQDRLRVYYGNSNATASSPLNIGGWNHVCVTYTASTNEVSVYVNDNLVAQFITNSFSTNNNNLEINEDGDTNFTIDELCLFDKALAPSEVTAEYNSGFGVSKNGATANVIGLWKFDESSGTQAADAHVTNNHFTISGTENTEFEWVDGIVGSSSIGSRGVATRAFQAGITQELQFSVQLPHEWAEGTDISPHIHWVPMDAGTGNVRWGLEYTWASIDAVFSNTTIITAATLTSGSMAVNHHNLTELPNIDATGKTLSSMLLCRIFRQGDHVDDTYAGSAGLLEIDFHYQINRPGSRTEYSN